MKTKIAVLLAAALVAGLFAVPGSAAAADNAADNKGKKKSGPQVVATDDAGDWGAETDPAIGPLGDALGQDLIEATIQMVDMQNIEFVIKVNSLPALGGMPELTRYTWNFTVDGERREFDGKFTNFSRGICDPTSGQCPPPRNPGTTPFFLRGECETIEAVATSFVACEELALIEAVFNADEGTITIPVSLELLGAKPGSKIEPMNGTFDAPIVAAPSAFATYGSFPMDKMLMDKTFVVASGKKAKKKKKK